MRTVCGTRRRNFASAPSQAAPCVMGCRSTEETSEQPNETTPWALAHPSELGELKPCRFLRMLNRHGRVFPDQKKDPSKPKPGRVFEKIRRYLLSHFWHYHRLAVLNYCVRDGNRCDHCDMFTGRRTCRLSTTRPWSYALVVVLASGQLEGRPTRFCRER
jgi:hypothetical protein